MTSGTGVESLVLEHPMLPAVNNDVTILGRLM